jgi:hypothetical protein
VARGRDWDATPKGNSRTAPGPTPGGGSKSKRQMLLW